MLFGEHAVLYGRHALVGAVDQRVHVQWQWRADKKIKINSVLGTFESSLDALTVRDPFRFVLAVLLAKRADLTHGLELEIKSDFPHNIGLGSSAAVTVATLAAFMAATGHDIEPAIIFRDAYKTILTVQGLGSGADVAASVYGGIVHYCSQPQLIEKLKGPLPPIELVYCGHKRPTAEVVRQVAKTMERAPELFVGVYDLIEHSVIRALSALEHQNWADLGFLCNVNQGLMTALGVDDVDLSQINFALRQDTGIYGAKISGAGMGDCVLGIGQLSKWDLSYQRLTAKLASEGVRVEAG